MELILHVVVKDVTQKLSSAVIIFSNFWLHCYKMNPRFACTPGRREGLIEVFF